MSHEPTVRELLAPMRDRAVDLDAEAFRVDRERVLLGMARVQTQHANAVRAPRFAYWGGLGAAAAAIALAALGAHWALTRSETPSGVAANQLELSVLSGVATQNQGAPTRASDPARAISADGELQTGAASKARLTATTGLDLELQGATRVQIGKLVGPARQLTLLEGAVRCRVAHRPSERPFELVTADTRVVDVGTVFTVAIDPVTHLTSVSVEDGEVQIQHGQESRLLKAPGSWSSAAPLPSAAASAEPALQPSTAAPSAAPARHPQKAPESATLAAEAQLLRQGLAAERQGHAADAAAALSQLLTKYPKSPLAPDARAALARVRAGTP